MLCWLSQVAGCWIHSDLLLIPLFSEGVDVVDGSLLKCPLHQHLYIPAASNCAFSQDGGCWINLGPLLFHWADAHNYLPEEELSIELSLEEVEAAAKQLGFKTIKREMVSAAYMTNLR